MAPRKLNVLVYAGIGTTSESVRHCLLTLRRLLYPNYAVIPVTEAALIKEPWQATCALLVIPGGADMGYSSVLNGAGNRRIAQYVRAGGRYLGLCAGGYYGSSRCEFEVGNTDLEVVGRRELGLFRGTCRGCAFKGFTYKSEAGARAVPLTIHRDAFTAGDEGAAAVVIARALDLPATAYSYYNGGGVFVDAKSASNVTVLASYADEIDVDGGSSKKGKEKGRAAVVYCTVGEGAAILTGPHPEFEPDNLSEQPEIPHYDELLRTLRKDDATQARVKFLKACLVKLGLELGSGDAIQPRLTALHVTTLYPDEVQELVYKWDEIITRSKQGNDAVVRGESDTFRVLLPDSGVSAWPSAANVKAMGASQSQSQTEPTATSAMHADQHQPFCAGMTLDLADRAMRYPALASLVERIATDAATSVQDTSMLVEILGALADHDDEGDVAAASPAPSLASMSVDEWRAKWKQNHAAFNRIIDHIYRAVGQVLLGHPDNVPALDPELRQEMWSALVHAWEVQRRAAETQQKTLGAGCAGAGAGAGAHAKKEEDGESEEGRLMQLIDEVAGDDADDGTIKKIVVYEGGWPARIAAFDYRSFYTALGEYRQAAASRHLGSASTSDGGDLDWGNQLMYAKVTTSTNTLLEKNPKLLATLPSGFTVTATRQLAGRGRGSNVWLAPEGQLILSTVINHPHRLPLSTSSGGGGYSSSFGSASGASRPVVFVQYLAAIAIVDAIHAYAPGYETLDVKLKWPNDIYARASTSSSSSSSSSSSPPAANKEEFVKIGGILSHCTFSDNRYQVVLGIGLNAVNERPTTSLQELLPPSVAAQSPPVRVETLLASLLVHLELLYRQFMRQGFAGELERRYYKHWLHTDQTVTLEAVEGSPRARVLGITNDWGLLKVAELAASADGRGEDRLTGRVWHLQSDENSFDYWKGLVRTKA